ncbi:acid resistance putative oxidoreductase YdeP [Escherichia coli]
MKKKIESYQGAAGGWGAVKSVANAVRKQMDIRQDVIAMFDMNKPEGFDCPGCAWPDPKHSASFDICENGAKAIAWEVTDKQVNASFFAENTVQSLLTWGDHELEAAGRLTQPLKYDAVSDCYKPLSWQQAFDEIGARLQIYSDPNQVEFYTSGRTSNEAAFLYQLFAREYGSNNFPDCSNMCHEPTSVGLAASIGVGKGTVLLEDFEKCDLVICIGHNPGTNHPRMLTSLRALVKRGAKMIAINPLQERGLERFTAPQNPFEMLTNSETQLASAYYNVRIGGDMALLKGMMRLLIERDDAASAAGRPSLLDDEFIQTHTVGFDELRRDVLNSEWKDIERISGLSQTQIAELADAYAAAERTIICYGMGITQHEHGTQNVQQLVNLLLMKGNIGKPGAGICPLRGHSNVQGDRTVGITEKPSAEFLARLGERYGFTPPHAPGHAAIASMQAICTGQARALICMGGNFALAMPDREASAVPLTQLDLAVHVATKLNRSHLLTARHSYILPVLGRSEIDMQKNGAQAVTVEDSMSMIHASRGVLKPAGVMLKSECAVVAGIAQAALPQSVVAWEYLVEDYDRIRNDIEAVLPEFADYNQRIRHPGGFHLINAAAERRWMTPSGKANFITSKGLLEATKTNVAFSDFTPTEYSTKGKPNIIVLTMDDLGYGQLPFDKGSFDPKTMENREVVDTYKIGIDKAIEAAQKSTPTLLSLMDEGVRFTNGYVAHGVSGPSRAAIMTGRAPARFGVYSNTDAQDGIPLTETFLPELFQNHGYYTAAVGKWHLSKISNVPVPEDKQTRDYHDNFTTFSAEEWQPQNRGFDYFMGFHAAGTAYYNSPSLFKNRERVPAKGYISDQLTDEAIGVVDRAKTLDQPFMLYLAYNAPHLPNDNPAPDQYQKQFNTGSQTADNYYASVYSVDQGVKRILEQLKKNGQYDNTIILFTSDNGAVIDGPLPLNGAQKGYKSQTYPGGTHTPMFMWWKGKLQPGNYDKLISAMDFYPTALDAADISIPKDLKLDGVSLLPWLQDKKQGEPHKNLTWITSYSHWFDEENIPFWDNYHKFVRHQSDDYPHNPNTEDLSQFSYTVRNNDYSLVYTVENNQLGLYKLTDLQQKDNLAAANPQVVKEMQGVVREFIDSSQPPLSKVNQEKFNNIKKALSEAK